MKFGSNERFLRNAAAFRARFPAIYEANANFFLQVERGVLSAETLAKKIGVSLEAAKNGETSASFGGLLLHSRHNPSAEAKKAVCGESVEKSCAAAFFGFGLGYAPAEFAKKFGDKKIFLVEPDFFRLALAFFFADFSPVFAMRGCFFLIGAPLDVAAAAFLREGVERIFFFSQPAFSAHAKPYFDALSALVERNLQKNRINEATFKKFKFLWLRNFLTNLRGLSEKRIFPVSALFGKFAQKSALVVCAGPTLDDNIEKIKELSKSCAVIVCDTALRFCRKNEIAADFVVCCDPQFWNYKHLADIDFRGECLVADLTVFPAVLRKSDKIFLCSSRYSFARFAEPPLEPFGEIGSGGSVATTAWEFAEKAGFSTIFVAGLDLAFCGKKTHFRGSVFEEGANFSSNRLFSTEKSNALALFGANPCIKKDYSGENLLTDSRFSLYAWWFESKCVASQAKTISISPKSLAIPGISAKFCQKIAKTKAESINTEGFLPVSVDFDATVKQILRVLTEFSRLCDEKFDFLDALFEKARKINAEMFEQIAPSMCAVARLERESSDESAAVKKFCALFKESAETFAAQIRRFCAALRSAQNDGKRQNE